MKERLKKISEVLKKIFGYGIFVSLFVGGLTFFGYLSAFVIGGETATEICTFIYKKIIPVIIYLANCMILLGIVSMYLSGEYALTAQKKKK